MLLSVVVPAYNEEKYLGACLDALCAQVHPNFAYEIIVVDDGSTDRTREIALACGVRVISQPNRGVASARQAGFEAARGEIIASTDADTVCPPDWLARIASAFGSDTRLVGIYGSCRWSDGSRWDDLIARAGMALQLIHCAIGKPLFCGYNSAVRRAAWSAVGGFNTDWPSAEDISLSNRLLAVGRIQYDARLVAYTSRRRMRLGFKGIVTQWGVNYARVFWLNKPGLPFVNIR